ncbi:MAG: hypothetical protein M3459_05410 [Actinomycetota bacterium]|nr:hypothetical protein [Actinomycetota bacterium]
MSAAALLARVRDYPYVPARGAFALGPEPPADAPEIVAFAANADPAVLAAKLGPGASVRGRPARLTDHDVVFSAHVSPYGAIPATLLPSPGTSVPVHLLRLAQADLQRLDATEPNYVREILGRGVEGYRSRHGVLLLDGAPVALTAVPATGRTLPALTQEALQERLCTAMEPGTDRDAFVLAGARDPEVRARRTVWLRENGLCLGHRIRRSPSPCRDDQSGHQAADRAECDDLQG